MTTTTIVLISVAATFIVAAALIYIFRNRVRKFLNKAAMKLQLSTLRQAIHDADANKEENGRKNIVIFNTVNKAFEPVEKRVLKRMADKNRNTNNAAKTKYRKRNHGKGKRVLDSERVKTIEKKSLYVTQ